MPASAVVGRSATLMVIVSIDGVQPPLLIVHINLLLLPIAKPVIPEVGFAVADITAVPDNTVHVPTPMVGVFPLSVVLLVLHKL